MLGVLQAPLVNDLAAQFRRRTEAINAIVAYCDVEEPLTTEVLEARRPALPPEVNRQLSPMELAREFRAFVIGQVQKVGIFALYCYMLNRIYTQC